MKQIARLFVFLLAALSPSIALAATNGHAAWVVSRGISKYNSALILAIARNQTDNVVALLEKGADPNACAKSGSVVCGKRTVSGWSQPALTIATGGVFGKSRRPENVRMVEALLDYGADVDARDNSGYTALMLAASENRLSTVQLLLERGADVTLKARKFTVIIGDMGVSGPVVMGGGAALDHAIGIGNIHDFRVVKLLLDNGADVNAPDPNGQTVLMRVSAIGNSELVRLLLAYRPSIDARGISGSTALMFAANRGNQDVIRLLVQAGANVNAADNRGRTVLMSSILPWTKPSVMRLLIQLGANVNAKALDGYTAAMLANRDGNMACANLLRRAEKDRKQ